MNLIEKFRNEEQYLKYTHNLTLSFLPLTIINVSLYSDILFALNFVCGQSGSTIQNDHCICKTAEFRKKKY